MQVMIDKLIDLENKELYLIFIDYSKAFDKVDHGRLFDVMLDSGIRDIVELVAGLRRVFYFFATQDITRILRKVKDNFLAISRRCLVAMAPCQR